MSVRDEVVVERDDTGLFGEATATFSPCMTWRYNLVRRWAGGPLLRWICLNPSTATAFVLDPTVTRLVKRAQSMGYAGVLVQNIFALRSTDPKGLYTHSDPVGPANDDFLADPAEEVGATIVAWGVHAKFMGRGAQVAAMLRAQGAEPLCLEITKDGFPKHPLYVANARQPVPYAGFPKPGPESWPGSDQEKPASGVALMEPVEGVAGQPFSLELLDRVLGENRARVVAALK